MGMPQNKWSVTCYVNDDFMPSHCAEAFHILCAVPRTPVGTSGLVLELAFTCAFVATWTVFAMDILPSGMQCCTFTLRFAVFCEFLIRFHMLADGQPPLFPLHGYDEFLAYYGMKGFHQWQEAPVATPTHFTTGDFTCIKYV